MAQRAADTPGIALLHSPLVGPLCWQPLAERLRADGYRVIAPDLTAAAASDSHQGSFIAAAVHAIGVAEMGSVVLVGHSGAGPLLPAIASAANTIGVIFVDAGLPHPGKSWFDTAPPPLTAHLKSLADHDGVLPRWSDWFDPAVLNEAIADPRLRLRFVDELPRLSICYFEQPTPATVWDGPTAYLQLSAVYIADADRAAAAGWPVQRLPEGHLAILTAPQHVLPALIALLEAVG
ncbi:MAG: alpha/beta hydrolase [Pseudonocardiaceae bacterium]